MVTVFIAQTCSTLVLYTPRNCTHIHGLVLIVYTKFEIKYSYSQYIVLILSTHGLVLIVKELKISTGTDTCTLTQDIL